MLKNKIPTFCRILKNAKEKFLAAARECPALPMDYDRNAKPLPKIYFSKGRKPIPPFSDFFWSNSTYTYVKYAPDANPQYDKVEGIKISPKLIVLRGCRGAYYPDVCKLIAQKFGGHIPCKSEMLQIINRLDRLNATFVLLGDKALCCGKYLIDERDEKNNFLAVNIEQPQQTKAIGIYDECFFIIVR
uniref:Uncharacterized protein n=1 Tax=uncultured Alphaproteobacteria bacterium TaxID=91750 RepID=A0A6G8F294_9PROT|nr:hypothetical protein PlAlph_0660 [uncultured Alphaproteobacteria bacterium]